MKITVHRFVNNGKATLSLIKINGKFECFGLEDEPREVKVYGETRIPAGLYEINLRAEGGMHQRYASKFPFHEGMLHLQNVPGFTYIYFHIGNTEDHTAGCILVGQDAAYQPSYLVMRSTQAYEALYKKVLSSAKANDLFVEILDEDL